MDEREADLLYDLLCKASYTYGVSFDKPPGFFGCSPNIDSWMEEIEKDVKENGKPQIIVLFLGRNEENFYGELKNFLTC